MMSADNDEKGKKKLNNVVYRNIPGFKEKQTLIHKKLCSVDAILGLFTEAFADEDLVNNHEIDGYAMYLKLRKKEGKQSRGGAMILVVDDGSWKHCEVHRSPENSKIESITIKMTGESEDDLVYATSLYARPGVEIEAAELTEALPMNIVPKGERWIVCSDINAHHELWDSFMEEDTRGTMVFDFMIDHELQSANDPEQPTRTAFNSKTKKETNSCPDLILCRGVNIDDFKTERDAHSDHNWITFELEGVTPGKATKRRYWNLNKADWATYSTMVDEMIKLEKGRLSIEKLSDIMYMAMRQCVPKTTHKAYTPLWTEKMTEAQTKFEKADAKQRENPTTKNIYEAKKAKIEMNDVHRDERRRVFWEKYKEARKTPDVWKLLRNVTGRARASNNIVVTEEVVNADGTKAKKEYKTDKEKAKAFVKKFAKVSKRTGPLPEKIKAEGDLIYFTMDEFKTSLRKTPRRKAVGPDEIPTEAVDNLSECAQKYLLEAMNYTYVKGDVPLVWRRGWIIPALKPKKDAADIASYRPITLTSQMSKIMERMIARRILFAIAEKLHYSQYGFRAGLSTTDALCEVVDEIVRAFDTYVEYDHQAGRGPKRAPQRAVAVLADFSSAFDTIGHCEVLRQLETMGCGRYEMRWVKSFLSGRQGKVKMNDDSSDWTDFESGVPQGTVLGPLLFIVAMNDLLVQLDNAKIKGVCFADDLTLVVRCRTAQECVNVAQKGMDIIENWTKRSCMIINVKKTFGILCSKTQSPAEELDTINTPLTYKGKEIRIYNHGDPLPYDESRLLGMHLDRGTTKGLDFHNHVRKVKSGIDRAKSATALLSGTTFGAESPMLVQFHNSLARSRECYGIEVYWDFLSVDNKSKLCGADRDALRRAVGLMPKSTKESIHYESGLRPLEIEAKIKQAIYFERTVRQGGNQTKRALRNPPENTKGNHGLGDYQRVPMDSCREAAYEVLQWAGIAVNRMKKGQEIVRTPLVRVSSIPPWARNNDNIIINTHLKEGASKKKMTELQQLALVEEVTERLQATADIAFWTDGSSHVKLRKSGAGATIYMKAGNEWVPWKQGAKPAGVLSCSFTAEDTALIMPLEELATIVESGQANAKTIVGFVDCQSLLIALKARSIDQQDAQLEHTWKLLLRIGKHVKLTLQHIFSHCGYMKSDEVDEMANRGASEIQKGVPVAFRDSCALIKAWGREQVKRYLKGHEEGIHPAHLKTAGEKEWTRAEQVAAAQLRANNVRIVGKWPREFDPQMAMSCRFCSPQDHMRKERTEAPKRLFGPTVIPQKSRAKIQCGKCAMEYADVPKFNRHLTTSPDCAAVHPKGKLLLLDKDNYPKENEADADVVRDASTGPEETLEHIFMCEEVKRQFGASAKFKEKVAVICKIKTFFDGVEKEEKERRTDERIRREMEGNHCGT